MKNNFIKITSVIIALVFTIVCGTSLFAEEQIPSYEAPVLVTSAGQCVDFKTVGMLVKRLKLEYEVNSLVEPDGLDGFNTMIVVVGHSLKGLGSAGISEADELKRVERVLDAAKSKGLRTVLFHLGGDMRRGPTSQPFIDATLAASEFVVVYEPGNTDDYFTNYCNTNNIPMKEIEKVAEARTILQEMFQ